MTKWEYARLESTGQGISVVFSHRQAWPRQGPEAFFETLRRLGDDEWELVTALPLTATATATETTREHQPASRDLRDQRDPRDPREMRDQRDSREGSGSGIARGVPQSMNVLLGTDRWLIFKRPLPEPTPSPGSESAEMIKGLVGRHVLKGRIPLP